MRLSRKLCWDVGIWLCLAIRWNSGKTAAQEKGANVIAATDILVSLYDHTIPVRSDLSDLYYLHELGIRDVVASAGLSMLPEWFERFCDYAEQFRL